MLTPTLYSFKWDPVAGATGWEIQIDGRKVATAGAKARSTRVKAPAEGTMRVAIVDLPGRTTRQEIEFVNELVAG